MSRFRRVLHGVASWYMLLGVSSICALASAPLAFRYLASSREFGLWALMSSIGLYLNLIDMGMSAAVARLLVDHKDRPGAGTYGTMIKTGSLVLALQGLLVWLAGVALAPLLCRLERIDVDLQAQFTGLLCWQCATLGVGFALRIFGHILQAHQRLDLFNYILGASQFLTFGLLWWFFHRGHGIYSLAWSGLGANLVVGLACWLACWWLHLFPPTGAWGRVSWTCFKELFAYGKDVFLITVGMQMIITSQPLIVTPCLGLEAATMWNLGTRAFGMVYQALGRVVGGASAALSEMVVRGERESLCDRYRSVVMVTASLGGVAAVIFALCNSTFVTVWMHGRIAWPARYDALLAVWMIILAVSQCHIVLVITIKRMGFLRYLCLLEGLLYVGAALLTARWGGLTAVIVCSIVCSSLCTGSYGVWRVSRYFGFAFREVAFGWLAPMARVLLWFVPAALLVGLVSGRVDERMFQWLVQVLQAGGLGPPDPVRFVPMLRLGVCFLVAAPLGAGLFLRYGLPQAFQVELLHRSPPRVSTVLRRLFAVPAQ